MDAAQAQFARFPYLHFPKQHQRWLKAFLDFAARGRGRRAVGAMDRGTLHAAKLPRRGWTRMAWPTAMPRSSLCPPAARTNGEALARRARRDAVAREIFPRRSRKRCWMMCWRGLEAPALPPVMPGNGKPFSRGGNQFRRPGLGLGQGRLSLSADSSRHRQALAGHSAGAAGAVGRDRRWRSAPECCLVNLYRDGASMGLHQDQDESDASARRDRRVAGR